MSGAKLPARAQVKAVCAILLVLCVCAGPVYGAIFPAYNWDMLAYIGILKFRHIPGVVLAHHEAYDEARSYAAQWALGKQWQELVNPANAYRHTMATDAHAFVAQFPFYTIRPLYLAAIEGMARLTDSMVAATVALSALAGLLANSAVAVFAVRRSGLLIGTVCAAAFGLSPAMFEVARMSTPDALAALLAGLGCIALLSNREILGAIILLVGVAARTDQMVLNAVLAAGYGIAALVNLRQRRPVGAKPMVVIALLLLSVAVAQWIRQQAGGYNYNVLFHVTFMEGFTSDPSVYADAPIPLRRHLTAMAFGIGEGFANGSFGAIALCLLGIGTLWALGRLQARERMLALAIAATLAARIALFPSADVRLTAPVFAALFCVLVAACGRALTSQVAPSSTRTTSSAPR